MSGRIPFHACKSYTQHNSWHRYVGKSFGYPGHRIDQRRCTPVASGLNRPRDTLLFGKPLRASSTKVCLERVDRPRIMNLGKVTMTMIGQPACLSPNLVYRQEHGEASETERVSVVNASLVHLRRLKIQSGPVGNHMGSSDGRPRVLQLDHITCMCLVWVWVWVNKKNRKSIFFVECKLNGMQSFDGHA